jgi:hypothetical protein
MKDFRKEIDSNLTKEQLARLKEMDDRRQEMIMRERKSRDNDTSNYRGYRRYNNEGRSFRDTSPHHDSDTNKSSGNK